MAKRKDTTQQKWKKKKWYSIQAPQIFGDIEVGHTTAIDKEELPGRTVKANLMHVLKSPKKQNVTIKFKITDVADGKAQTKTTAYTMVPGSIKRFVRAGRDRVDESFIIKSKDGIYARIKPLMITYTHQPAALKTKVRKQSISFLRKNAMDKTLEEFVKAIVEGSVTKELRTLLSKTCGLRNCEIRSLEVIENFSAARQKKLDKQQEE